MKRFMCFAFSLLLIVSFTACSPDSVSEQNGYQKKASSELPSDTLLAENASYRLEWDEVNVGVALTEKSTGKRWGTTPLHEGEATVDEYGMPIKKNPQVQSSLTIEYLTGEQKTAETAVSYTGAYKNGTVIASPISNGVRVEYYFDKAEIMVPVEYVLREDSVAVTVNPKEIEENENQLISVSIAPFWCSAENDRADSYLFVPSGSGALVSCRTLSQQGSKYSYSVYGDDAGMQREDLPTTGQNVLLPVFGSKSGSTATCAIIENAAESANIGTTLGSLAMQYSAVYAVYQLRGYSENVATMPYNGKQRRNVYASDMALEPMTVGFYPLSGENADYTGMAAVYKKYLKKQNQLSEKQNDSALSLTFVGGTMVSKSFLGIPYHSLLPAATLQDVKEILAEIADETDLKINARLIGFGVSGIDCTDYAGGFKINKNLGSLKDLSDLSDFCKSHNIDLFFDFDLIRFQNGSSGYSTLFDTAYNACMKNAVGYQYDVATRSRIEDKSFYYLSREKLTGGADKLLKKIKKWNLSGISLSSVSNMAYSDYSETEHSLYYSKGNMAKDTAEIIGKVSEHYKFAASCANAYAAVLADIIYDTPACSTGEQSFICDIPFYQMVFKGYIPMAGESLNLAADSRKQLLSYVETGCGISYTLTADFHKEFIDSGSCYFFGTQYADLKESLLAASGRLKDYYKAVNGAEIVSHRILENDVRETVFDNGIKVYVNVSDRKAGSPLGEIEAWDFLWR